MRQLQLEPRQDEDDPELVQGDHYGSGLLSSALRALSYSLHTRFRTYLKIKDLEKETSKNVSITSLLMSEANVCRAENNLDNLPYENDLTTTRLRSQLAVAQYESEETIFRAKTNIERAKHQLSLTVDADLKVLKKQEAMLNLEDRIERFRLSIRKSQLKGRERPAPPGRPSPDENRDKTRERLDAEAKRLAVLDAWRRDELRKLDEEKRAELAEIEAAPWAPEEKSKKKYEVESRFSKRKEQLLTIKPGKEA